MNNTHHDQSSNRPGGPTGVLYLRVSTAAQDGTDGDGEGFSIAAQRDACFHRAEAMGVTIIDEYADRGESAKSADRAELKAMLDRLQRERDVDFVFVHKVDRLARNRADDVGIGMAIRQASAQLISVSENVDDTPAGKLLHAVMSGIAEYFSTNLATECLKGMEQKAQRGGTPGRAPIGYLNVRKPQEGTPRGVATVEVDPERAPHVQWAFKAYASEEWSTRQLTDELERRGLVSVPTAKKPSKPVHLSKVSAMLSNPYYVGVVRFRGVEYPGRHEPIVDRATFEKVQEVLARNTTGSKARRHRHYLRGSLWCAECDSRLIYAHAKGNGGIYPYYFCVGRRSGCTQPYVPVATLEAAVEDHYRSIQLDPATLDAARTEVSRRLANDRQDADRVTEQQQRRIDRLIGERHSLLQAHYAGAVPLDLLKSEQTRIARELDDAERLRDIATSDLDEVEALVTRAVEVAADCHRSYRAAPPDTRRRFNQAFFERIFVGTRGGVEATELTEPFEALYRHPVVAPEGQEILGTVCPTRSTDRNAGSQPSLAGSKDESLVPPTGFEPVPPP